MNINFQLAKEIFGIVPWFVDAHSLPSLMTILKNSKSGISLELPEKKYNAVSYLNYAENSTIINSDSWYDMQKLKSNEDFEAIAIVSINGPITKSGGASSYGMDYVSSNMLKLNQDKRIKGFLIYCDSGGGSSAAVEIMDNTISEIKKTKPVYSLIEKGGLACSAMYGIISGSNKIYSESLMNIIGSVGTMIAFEGRKANSESPDGVKYIRLYATKSTKKNEDFEQALNNDNYQLLTDNLLNPVNENFIQMVENNRPQLKGTDFSNGNDKFAKDCVGTFIDGIKSFSEVVDEIMLDYKQNYESKNPKSNELNPQQKKPNIEQKNNINNSKQKKMTVEELKQQHPETYNSIFGAGVSAEKDRVETWMAHSETDPEMVKKGIKSGKPITSAEREELLVKSVKNANLAKIETDSKGTPTAPSAASVTTEEEVEEKEIENFYGNILK